LDAGFRDAGCQIQDAEPFLKLKVKAQKIFSTLPFGYLFSKEIILPD
jgi:hypothetical protein